jgi:hypothetical protein
MRTGQKAKPVEEEGDEKETPINLRKESIYIYII